MKTQRFGLSKRVCMSLALAIILLSGFGVGQNALAKRGVPDSFAELADKQGLVAVNISTTKVVKGVGRFSPFQGREFRDFFGDEFFRRFFGETPQ